MATRVCATHGIHVTFEEVVPGSDLSGARVVHGTDALPEAGSTAVKRKASEASEERVVEQPKRRPTMKYEQGKTMKEKLKRELELDRDIAELLAKKARRALETGIAPGAGATLVASPPVAEDAPGAASGVAPAAKGDPVSSDVADTKIVSGPRSTRR